jgi:hypothetical protein
MNPGPAQEQFKRLGRTEGALQLGRLQPVARMSAAPPILPAVALRRAGPQCPLICICFVIATDAGGAVAMGVMTLQFLSPLNRPGWFDTRRIIALFDVRRTSLSGEFPAPGAPKPPFPTYVQPYASASRRSNNTASIRVSRSPGDKPSLIASASQPSR